MFSSLRSRLCVDTVESALCLLVSMWLHNIVYKPVQIKMIACVRSPFSPLRHLEAQMPQNWCHIESRPKTVCCQLVDSGLAICKPTWKLSFKPCVREPEFNSSP